MTRSLIITVAAFGVLASTAFAGVVHQNVDRSVSVDFSTPSAPTLMESDSTDGLWDETVSDFVFDDFGASGSGTAFQRSNLTMRGVSIAGEVSANASTDGFVSATTELNTLITVDEASEYRATAELFDLFLGNPDLSFSVSLTADGGDGDVVWSASSFDEFIPDTGSFGFGTETGMLAAGDYQFSLRVSVGGFKDTTTASGFSVQLVIPAPGTGGMLAIAGLVATRRRR